MNRRFSDAVEFAAVNVVKATCIIRFKKSGDEYLYKNVSNHRLLSLLSDNKSLGFWIQFLSKNAIPENRFRPRTGAMTYQRIGNSYKASELPALLLHLVQLELMDITSSDNFIKDAVIDHVLMDLGLQLSDLRGLDKYGWDMFEILCLAKADTIRGH